MTAKLLKIDGTSVDIIPENGKDFKLHECYKHIGCDIIEVVYLDGKNILIIDEEGLLKEDATVNRKATTLAREAGTATAIVGNVILCSHKMLK